MQQFSLRPYQKRVIKEVYANFKNGKTRVLVWAPTGSGKTVMALQVAKDCLSRGWRLCFLVHRRTLAVQAARTFTSLGEPVGFVWAERPYQPSRRVQIISVQTMEQRDIPWLGEPKTLWVVDEAHTTAVRESIVPRLRDPGQSWWLGLSATVSGLRTPIGMADLFDAIVRGPHYNELFESGVLVRPEVMVLEAKRRADLSSAKVQGGEYVASDVARILSDKEHLKTIIGMLPPGRPIMSFSPTVAHAELVASLAPGRVAIITGTKEKTKLAGVVTERETIIRELEAGRVDWVASVDALSEGFDVPRIVGGVDMQPLLASRARHVQKMGRIARSFPGKDKAWWFDAVGNCLRFGALEHQPLPELEHAKEKRSKRSDLELPRFMICRCGALVSVSASRCPSCGRRLSFKPKEPPAPKDVVFGVKDLNGNLLTPGKVSRKRNDYVRWAREAFERGWKPGYALMRYKRQYGGFPAWQVTRGAVFGTAGKTDSNIKAYRAYLEQVCTKKSDINRWMRYEFGRQTD